MTNLLAAAAATLVLGLAIPAQASGYAPGHVMQQRGSKNGFPGASGYAPGRATTTGSGTGRR